MKKILTLLIAAGSFVSIHAQSREESRRVILGDPKDNSIYGNNDRDVVYRRDRNDRYPVHTNNAYGRQYRIDQVNREYDSKIYSIRNNRYLSSREKTRMIRQLEMDRRNKINDINRRYDNDYKRYDDNDRYDRHDNGKHKGWYKKDKNKNWKNETRDWDDD